MNDSSSLVRARQLAVDMPHPEDLPADIQFLPPGVHTINAEKGGVPATLTVVVNQQTAEVVANAVRAYRKDAAAGRGDLPYLIFDHQDREASARVLEI